MRMSQSSSRDSKYCSRQIRQHSQPIIDEDHCVLLTSTAVTSGADDASVFSQQMLVW